MSQFSLRGLSVKARRMLIAAASVALGLAIQWQAGNAADEWLRDNFIRVQARDIPESRIAVVDIDEGSLHDIGPWPWPRTRIAELADSLLSDYGARKVALDMLFPDPADPSGDRKLAKLARTGSIVMAEAFDYFPRPVPLSTGVLAGGFPLSASMHAKTAKGYIANHAGLADATAGNIGFMPDADGELRHLPLWTAFNGRAYPSLALALCCAEHPPALDARIPYSRKWSSYTVVPASDILNLRAPLSTISGKLVLVGSSALGLSDRVSTPLSSSTAGVMVHAAELTSLLDGQAGALPKPWPGKALAAFYTLLIALLAVYTFPRYSALYNMALLAGTSLLWLMLAYAIAPHDPSFSPGGPLFANLFLLVVAVPYDWQIARQESRQLLATLRQYVARSVVDELLKSRVKNPLAPARREVTTLIADMEGYTGQVESLTMEEAAKLTRDFLDCLTVPVLDKGGTIDKYTGDGLVAFWGAPLPVAEHADLALDAAKGILQSVRRLSQAREREGKPPLRVRIGLESGTAMAGDFGSSSRSIYTAVGDCVNVASRLQSLARNYPHDVITGPNTAALAKRHSFILLEEVTLRGKIKPTTLYALATDGL